MKLTESQCSEYFVPFCHAWNLSSDPFFGCHTSNGAGVCVCVCVYVIEGRAEVQTSKQL